MPICRRACFRQAAPLQRCRPWRWRKIIRSFAGSPLVAIRICSFYAARSIRKPGACEVKSWLRPARRLSGFLSLTHGRGGLARVIVDSADEMNRNAVNAILKLVEEPPSKALIILVSHVPGWLPATVRSRCRKLALAPLGPSRMEQLLTDRFPELPRQTIPIGDIMVKAGWRHF